MKIWIIFFVFVFSTNVHGEEGLLTHLTFNKQKLDTYFSHNQKARLLAKFNSSHRLNVANLYSLSISNQRKGRDKVSIFISLSDISSGHSNDIGYIEREFRIGEQQSFSFDVNGYNYIVLVDTATQPIP